MRQIDFLLYRSTRYHFPNRSKLVSLSMCLSVLYSIYTTYAIRRRSWDRLTFYYIDQVSITFLIELSSSTRLSVLYSFLQPTNRYFSNVLMKFGTKEGTLYWEWLRSNQRIILKSTYYILSVLHEVGYSMVGSGCFYLFFCVQ